MKIITILLCVTLCLITTVVESSVPGSQYLYAPRGKYSVGYQDLHFINDKVCPDLYFNGHNQDDFSPNNQQLFCREIMTRIYYPSSQKLQRNALEYRPMVRVWQNDFTAADLPDVTPQQIADLAFITTYTQKELRPARGTFPVIFFNPGIDDDAQDYEDLITDIVSHGYVVVAINNSFVSSAVEFPDQHVITYMKFASVKKLKDAVKSDISFVYQKIHDNNQTISLFNIMDMQHTALLGHSLGAVATVIMAHQHPDWFQAAVALAAPAYHGGYAAYRGFRIPFMHIHDADWSSVYAREKGANVFHLMPQEYFVLLTPDPEDINYTHHNNFADASTLQYQPVFQSFSHDEATSENPYPLDIGTIAGDQVIYTINQYIINFFDTFLKNKDEVLFKNCIPLQNTLMTCGPGEV